MLKLKLVVFTSCVLVLILGPASNVKASTITSRIKARGEVQSKLLTNHRTGVFYVKYKQGVDSAKVDRINSRHGVPKDNTKEILSTEKKTIQAIRTKNNMEETMIKFALDDNVEYIEVAQPGKLLWDDTVSGKLFPYDYDILGDTHWYLNKINLPGLFADQQCDVGGVKCGGENEVVVAIIDTGIASEENLNFAFRYYYPYFPTQVYTFENYYSVAPQLSSINLWVNDDPYGNGDEDANNKCDDLHGFDADAELTAFPQFYTTFSEWQVKCNTSDTAITKEGRPLDDFGHGTAITNIIAANTNDSVTNSPVGISHNVTTMPIKVTDNLGNGFVYSDAFLNGVKYAVDNGAHIINVSLGWDGPNSLLEEAVEYATQHNVVIVAASGNDSENIIDYPASYADTIAVGAINSNNTRSSYSNYGSGLDFVAPVGQSGGIGGSISSESYACFFHQSGCRLGSQGSAFLQECSNELFNNKANCENNGDVWLTKGSFTNFETNFAIGTSFAAPQVTSAVALIKSKKPSATISEINYILQSTSLDLGSTGWDEQFGYGLIDLEALWNNIWTTWGQHGGKSINEIAAENFNSRIYQAASGVNSPNFVFIRSSADGVFDGINTNNGSEPDALEIWNKTLAGGKTSSEPELAVFNNKLYLGVKSYSNSIYYIKTMDASGSWDSTWTAIDNNSLDTIALESFNPSSGDRLYNVVRGELSNQIKVRYSLDGIFDNSISEENWKIIEGTAADTINLEVFDSKLFMSYRGFDNKIYTRSTLDGENWTPQTETGGSTFNAVNLQTYNSKLYQSVKGKSTNIFIRHSHDGENWSRWISTNGKTNASVEMYIFNSKLHQIVPGKSLSIFDRVFID